MTRNVLQGQKIMVNGDGKQYRSFVHVKDVADHVFFQNIKKN